MKRVTFNKFNHMKVNEQRELLHNLDVAFDASQTVKNQMAFAYTPWKEAYEAMVRAYDTSYKSPESDEIHTLDQMIDNLLASAHGVANGLRKSPDSALAGAAAEIMQAYKSFKVVYSSSYISQKPQVDSLLTALLENHRQSVETCGLLPVYERVRSLNDRMHELVDQRDQTLPDPQRTAKRETAIARCLDLFDYINGYWLVTLHMADVSDDLQQFFTTTDNIFKRYERVLGLGSNSTNRPSAGEEETDGDESSPPYPSTPSTPTDPGAPNEPNTPGEGTTEPQYSIATFNYFSGRSEEIRALVGSLLNAPANTEGYRWIPAVPSTIPAVNTFYTEEAVGAEKFTVAWYLPDSNPIIWYELAPGEVIPETPACPEGYYWHPYPSLMPDHDLGIIPESING